MKRILIWVLKLLFRGTITDPYDPVAEAMLLKYPATMTAEQCNELTAERWQD